MGFIQRIPVGSGSERFEYVILTEHKPSEQETEITAGKILFISKLFSAVGNQPFSLQQVMDKTKLSSTSCRFYLEYLLGRRFAIRAPMAEGRHMFKLVITPDDHPECFSASEVKPVRRHKPYPAAASGGFVAV